MGDEHSSALGALWAFFAASHGRVLDRVERGIEAAAVDDELWRPVKAVDRRFGYELGPETAGGTFFALAPQGSRDALALARRAIRSSPAISGWTFHAGRPPRSWNRRIVQVPIGGRITVVDYDAWSFRFVPPTTLASFAPSALTAKLDETWIAYLGTSLAEAELGDAFVIDHDVDVRTVSSDRERDTGPIAGLRASVLRGLRVGS